MRHANAMTQKTREGIALACAIALASPGALAHAELHHASPEAGSAVSESPHEVTLTFTDTLEPTFTSADVTDSGGRASMRASLRSLAT
jgi:methionine-rich copper-binding protein CopC